jgi:hypothetical protein
MMLKKLRKLKRWLRNLANGAAYGALSLKIQLTQKLNTAHAISQERVDFLEANFFQLSLEEREPDRALFDTITDPIELHYLAHIYNWDDGPKVLGWIADSTYCDRGTAAMIFWRSQPDFHQEYTSELEMSLQDGVLPLLQSIIRNWEREFYQQQIAYNRHDDPAAGKFYPHNPREKWSVPKHLLKPTKGKPFFFA